MPAFAIQTEYSESVQAWMRSVTEKLEEHPLIRLYFGGRIRDLGGGVYVISLQLLIPRFIINAIAFIMAAIATIVYHLGFPTVGTAGYVIALALALVWNALWSPAAYRVFMRLGARRHTGQWVSIKDATKTVLERVADGTV